ncbi:uncharacterized protein LOC126738999 [Anthonomus grandis grandis]|uniref:uncharacterized protein LOC126738999 n=1 Tax=Anthonomus grandis grandis TaxID=2921223 RepID=UPI002165D676|nr:uncharacterized protein LOC126738999 [Anthonomus grandis grandis]
MTQAFSVPPTKSKIKQLLATGAIGPTFYALFSKKWFRVAYMFLLTVFFTIGFLYSVYGRFNLKFNFPGASVLTFMDSVTYLFLTLANLSTVQALWKYEKSKESIRVLVEYLASKKKKSAISLTSYIPIAIGFLGLTGNFYAFNPRTFVQMYQYYVLQDLQFVYLHFTLLVQIELVNGLRDMFADLNEEFDRSFAGLRKVNSVIDGVDLFTVANLNAQKPQWPKIRTIYLFKPANYECLKKLSKKHNDLCHITEEFNECVASIAFVSLIGVIANIIRAVILFINADIMQISSSKFDISPQLPFEAWICNIFYNICWIISMFGQVLLYLTAGHRLESEGNKITSACTKLLSQLSFNDENQQDTFCKQQLILLSTQAEARCPVIKGGNGVIINLSVLGSIVMNVFAFTVVCTQFILNDRKRG